jgi:hypothetical protein
MQWQTGLKYIKDVTQIDCSYSPEAELRCIRENRYDRVLWLQLNEMMAFMQAYPGHNP